MVVDRQPGYVLHTRSYRESSQLLDVLTPGHGLVRLVGRGVKRSAKQAASPVQPFREILLSWKGRGDLYTMTGFDEAGAVHHLSGMPLFSAMYINELTMKLLAPEDPSAEIYDCYSIAIAELATGREVQKTLRLFEKRLLSLIGYEMNLVLESETGEAVDPDAVYRYDIESGPVKVNARRSGQLSISGGSLLSLAAERLEGEQVLKECKMLMRAVLSWHMGGKPLKSRDLFNQF
jgi:DNA repair protein RecO (recombination protein O)